MLRRHWLHLVGLERWHHRALTRELGLLNGQYGFACHRGSILLDFGSSCEKLAQRKNMPGCPDPHALCSYCKADSCHISWDLSVLTTSLSVEVLCILQSVVMISLYF